MNHPMTLLLVGAGKFGRHYTRILSRMGPPSMPKPAAVHRLVLTCTSREKAGETATNLAKDPSCKADIIGERVDNGAALTAVLERHRPDITFIAAKDPTLGNRIHAEYSLQALSFGSRVLCEKPFSEAQGNGVSLAEAARLIPFDTSGAFGLELPFAAVRKQMNEKLQWETLFLNLGSIQFFWGTRAPIGTDLFNELAPHPWSLIPDPWQMEQIRTEQTETTAEAVGILRHDSLGRTMDFRITLSKENRFRGFRSDNRCFSFRPFRNTVQLIELDASIKTATSLDPSLWPGKVLLEADNPLRQNILASILGEPITGVRRTVQSQLFLEMLQGYRP